jgi:hypothetical protein
MTTTRVQALRLIGAAALLCTVMADGARAACSTSGQVARLNASPAKCTERQLGTLDEVLSRRLHFRALLDLPLAIQVLRERKCPSAEEFVAFFAAWRELPKTGVAYAVKPYCLTPPTVYRLQFLWPDKPLDDTAATRLSADIAALENTVIPALSAKLAAVDGMMR